MRVISGERRGLKLLSLEGDDTRPTLDRVKEALFSMLIPYLNSACVLDLFAGSGALGIEALSRGASKVDFVDSLPSAMDIVKQNVHDAVINVVVLDKLRDGTTVSNVIDHIQMMIVTVRVASLGIDILSQSCIQKGTFQIMGG